MFALRVIFSYLRFSLFYGLHAGSWEWLCAINEDNRARWAAIFLEKTELGRNGEEQFFIWSN